MVTADPDTVALFNAHLQALKMRRADIPYSAIAWVMREYHGIDRAPETWRHHCRNAGCPPSIRGHGGHFKAAS